MINSISDDTSYFGNDRLDVWSGVDEEMRSPLSVAGVSVASFFLRTCLVYMENPTNDAVAVATAAIFRRRCEFFLV